MEKNNFPLVSLITPGWNGVSFVGRLLDSILNQTYPNMEYIYIDDGSTDGTKDVVLSYKEKFQKAGISFEYVYKENGNFKFPSAKFSKAANVLYRLIFLQTEYNVF